MGWKLRFNIIKVNYVLYIIVLSMFLCIDYKFFYIFGYLFKFVFILEKKLVIIFFIVNVFLIILLFYIFRLLEMNKVRFD